MSVERPHRSRAGIFGSNLGGTPVWWYCGKLNICYQSSLAKVIRTLPSKTDAHRCRVCLCVRRCCVCGGRPLSSPLQKNSGNGKQNVGGIFCSLSSRFHANPVTKFGKGQVGKKQREHWSTLSWFLTGYHDS